MSWFMTCPKCHARIHVTDDLVDDTSGRRDPDEFDESGDFPDDDSPDERYPLAKKGQQP